MKANFSTKAGTLNSLKDCLRTGKVAPLCYFTSKEWHQFESECMAKVHALVSSHLVVRSSCLLEDTSTESRAGAYLSLLDVMPSNAKEAIAKVFESYPDNNSANEVLIQPMLKQVIRSGVAFSHDPSSGAPYRIINWSESSNTTVVTAGGKGTRTWFGAATKASSPAREIASVLPMIDELLAIFNKQPLDLEFAVTMENGKETLWLLQARKLVIKGSLESEENQGKRLKLIAEKIANGMRPHPFVLGKRTVYGVMPDWNPAEIIGVRPKPLSLSLYRELVTDSIWAYQRNNYGYRNLRSHPLMPHFFGLPYIDVRLSFNSFIPADLDEGIASRLVDFYIDKLTDQPNLHDKVEFEIVFSCYTLDLPERLEKLREAGFNKDECATIAESLRNLTNKIIHPRDGLWKSDADKLTTLNERRESILTANTDILEKIYWLLEDGKRYGTLPFAGLARAGFIAVQMLRSLVQVGVFSQEDYDRFMASLSTVSGKLSRDRAILDKTTFLSLYGHLRPGTYDVTSPRYDEAPDLYFDWNAKPSPPQHSNPFSVTLPQMREIVRLLNEHHLYPDGVGLFDFLQAGIELRELSKFHFSRNLSDAISLIIAYGEKLGFSREDIAYCDINVFKELYISAADPVDLISRSIDQGKARYSETICTTMPPLIVKPEDIYSFEWPEALPNFITQKQITAGVVSHKEKQSLKGSIVCIPNADPGFDWLFGYEIAGLITAWGGTNSHMAIRASELGLPAVIGAGELLYKKWSNASRLFIDCSGKRVEVLS